MFKHKLCRNKRISYTGKFYPVVVIGIIACVFNPDSSLLFLTTGGATQHYFRKSQRLGDMNILLELSNVQLEKPPQGDSSVKMQHVQQTL